MEMERVKIAQRITWHGFFVNLLLTIGKILAGIFGNSAAMLADGIHSLSDFVTDFIVIIFVRISGEDRDKNHPYGHGKFETMASLLISIALFAVAVGICVNAAKQIFSFIQGNALESPSGIAMIAAVVCIVTKEALYQYTAKMGKKIDSPVLIANAWHHRSDALSSIGALIGIFGSRMGFPVMDALASLIICIFIEKAAFDIFKDAIDKMVDKSCPEEVVDKMKKAVMEVGEVKGVDDIKTRLFGAKIYVEVEIAVDANETLINAHRIAEEVHDHIEEVFPEVKHCMVHVNPDMEKTEQIQG